MICSVQAWRSHGGSHHGIVYASEKLADAFLVQRRVVVLNSGFDITDIRRGLDRSANRLAGMEIAVRRHRNGQNLGHSVHGNRGGRRCRLGERRRPNRQTQRKREGNFHDEREYWHVNPTTPPALVLRRERASTLSIVIPLFNEAGNVDELLRRVGPTVVRGLARTPARLRESSASTTAAATRRASKLLAAAPHRSASARRLAVAQLRSPDRGDGRARRVARRRGRAHGRRPARSARAHRRVPRAVSRGLRRRVRDPAPAQRARAGSRF